MSEFLRHRACTLAAALLALVCANAAAASAIPDPTRPAIPTRALVEPGSAAPAAALVLQSTLVSPRQRSAIINGQRYRLGERIGDARLEAIGPGWVRLATPTGRTELRLSYSTLTRPVNR